MHLVGDCALSPQAVRSLVSKWQHHPVLLCVSVGTVWGQPSLRRRTLLPLYIGAGWMLVYAALPLNRSHPLTFCSHELKCMWEGSRWSMPGAVVPDPLCVLCTFAFYSVNTCSFLSHCGPRCLSVHALPLICLLIDQSVSPTSPLVSPLFQFLLCYLQSIVPGSIRREVMMNGAALGQTAISSRKGYIYLSHSSPCACMCEEALAGQ